MHLDSILGYTDLSIESTVYLNVELSTRIPSFAITSCKPPLPVCIAIQPAAKASKAANPNPSVFDN